MHIPDGLMDPRVAAIGFIEFGIAMAIVFALSRRRLTEKGLPRLAVLSAGIFAAQMINFPVGGGTTGHLLGGTLLALIMSPTMAIIGMSVVVVIQALMFGDGGITAIGLNAVNMAIIAPVSGWAVYTLLSGKVGNKHNKIALGIGAWASVLLASAACAAELTVSHAVSGGVYGIGAAISVPSILGYHVVIGLGEAAITLGVVAYLEDVEPRMFRASRPSVPSHEISRARSNLLAAIAILVVFALVLPLYFLYAVDGKDGLEQTVSHSGGAEAAGPVISSPFSYGQSYFEALFAGLLGFAVVAMAASGIALLLNRREVK